MTWLAILGCVAGALAVDLALDPDRRAVLVRWWRSRPPWELTVEFNEPRKAIAHNEDLLAAQASLREGMGSKSDPLALRPGLPSASDWADLGITVEEAAAALHETGVMLDGLGRNGGSGRRGGNVSGGRPPVAPPKSGRRPL